MLVFIILIPNHIITIKTGHSIDLSHWTHLDSAEPGPELPPGPASREAVDEGGGIATSPASMFCVSNIRSKRATKLVALSMSMGRSG